MIFYDLGSHLGALGSHLGSLSHPNGALWASKLGEIRALFGDTHSGGSRGGFGSHLGDIWSNFRDLFDRFLMICWSRVGYVFNMLFVQLLLFFCIFFSNCLMDVGE